jgi:hypothetical protein
MGTGNAADTAPKVGNMDDVDYVEDRMKRFANSSNSLEDINKILVEGMGDIELRAFTLGVRAGKHWAAIEVAEQMHKMSNDIMRRIDPYIK